MSLPPETLALIYAAARVIGSVLLLAFVLWAVSRMSRLVRLDAELGRKLVHISLGLYCLTFPWIFDSALEVAAMCALAAGVFMLARGVMRKQLGEGLHGVTRQSYGELLFALSVALLFWLKDGHHILAAQNRPPVGPILYVLPVLLLTLCDAASALVGSRYGQRKFQIERGAKSVEGVVAFALTAWLLALIALLLLTDIGRSEVILLAFIAAAFGSLLEAASWRGLDNLFIPLGLYFLLANLLHLGVPGLSVVAGLFLVALIGLLVATRSTGADRHFLAIGATLFFCIAIFSGVLSLLAPALAVAIYLLLDKRTADQRPDFDALNLLLVILSIAMGFFLYSNAASVDTIFAYNVAFAALAAAIAARSGVSLPIVALAALLAWSAMCVRAVLLEQGRSDAWFFAALGAAAITAVAALGWFLRGRPMKRPWLVLGGASFAAGLILLPASPT